MNAFVGNCKGCGYSLVHLTEPRCPECGQAFNPDDPATMELFPSRLRDFLTRKTTAWTLFPAFIACGAAGGAMLAHWPLVHAVQFLAILILAGTLYVSIARYRFQSWMKTRQRKRARAAATSSPPSTTPHPPLESKTTDDVNTNV